METVDASPAEGAAPAQDEHLARLEEMAEQGLSVDAEDYLYDMIDSGAQPTVEHYNAVIDSCALGKDVEKADRWLFRMQALEVTPNMDTYNALIHVAGESSNGHMVQEWFQRAQEEGLDANLRTYQVILDARRQAGDVTKVESWFEHMMLADVQPDIECCNSVIGTFAAAGKMKKVEEWLGITEHRLQIPLNVESYNHAIAGYVSTQDISAAERTMEWMADKGVEPNAQSFTLLIGDGTSYRELSTIERWSEKLLEAGVELAPETYEAVVGAFSAAGGAQMAEQWYSRMVEEGKQTAEALARVVEVLVLSRDAGGMDNAQDWVAQFRGAGLPLTPAVYAAMASKDVLRGDFEQVEARLQQMDADGLEMDERSLTALLLSYGNAEPQQSGLAEQMFKQQMLQGRLEASREILEALRNAVGGARCLALRRELQLAAPLKQATSPGRGKRLTEAGYSVAGLELKVDAAPVLAWE